MVLGANEKALKDLLVKNQTKSAIILNMLSKNQESLAKIELEQALGKALTKADNIRNLTLKFGRSAFLEKELIPKRHDEYSDITLKLISKIELSETEDLIITEALSVNVINNLNKVQSTYYHSMNNYALYSPDSFPRTLNEYLLDLAPFKINDPQYGHVQAVSYKCIYPNKVYTSAEREQEYLQLIAKAQIHLQELRARSKLQNNNSQIKESQETYQQNSTGGSSSSR